MADVLTFPLKDWAGVSGRSLIQGVKWDGSRFLIAQADDVGKEFEDVVLHEHAADLSYTGKSQTLKQAGHGSSIGLEPVPGGTRVWIGHKTLGVGFYLFGDSTFTKTPGVPNGDVAVDADHDLLCVRVGNRYRGYSLSGVEAGKINTLFDQSIPAWGKRFQGHQIARLSDGNVYVIVHRDVETNGDSNVDWFKVLDGKLYAAGRLNTRSPKGEAEGVMLYDGSVWAVKRLGGNNSGRTVVAHRMSLNVLKKTDEVDVIHDSSKHWDEDVRLAALEVDKRYPRHEWTSTYPGHGENSAKGAYAVDFMCNKSDGDKIAAYVWKNRKRLGVRYVIWDREIISETSSTPNRWVRYFNGGSSNPSKAHTNHVHVSFYTNRKYSPPAGSTPPIGVPEPVVAPVVINKPAPVVAPVVKPVVSVKAVQAALKVGADVGKTGMIVQSALNAATGSKLTADGELGANSRAVAAGFQADIARLDVSKAWSARNRSGFHPDADGILGKESLTKLSKLKTKQAPYGFTVSA